MDTRRSEFSDDEEMIDYRCPYDNFLILRYSKSTVGKVEGKCKRCHTVWSHVIPPQPKKNTEQ